jgi:HEAT repeat protein
MHSAARLTTRRVVAALSLSRPPRRPRGSPAWRHLWGAFVACLLATVGLCAQSADAEAGDDLAPALDRWLRGYLAGRIDVTDPKPIKPDAPPRLPRRLLASQAARLNELQALELLLRASTESGRRDVAERILQLAALGLDGKDLKVPGVVIVRGAAEAALDECAAPAVHAYLFDTAARPTEASAAPLRLAAVRALGASAQSVFWPSLVGLLHEPDPRLRAAAARALGDLGRPQALGAVIEALRGESDGAAVQGQVQALTQLLDAAAQLREADPKSELDAIRATATALGKVRDWRVATDLIRFLDRHRAVDAVPALIGVLEAATQPAVSQLGKTGKPDERGLRFLQVEAHRVLRSMTGAVFGADDAARWRAFWDAEKDKLTVVARSANDLVKNATVAGGFFGIPVLGRRVVFVLDRSGSMQAPAPRAGDTSAGDAGARTRLDVAREECWNAIKDMAPDTYFNVIVFSSGVDTWKPDLVPATPSNKGALRNYLERLKADGSTNLWGGLSTGTKMRTAASNSSYREPVDEIFLLSDGYPSSGEITDAYQIVARVDDQNRHAGIRINTVFIGSEPSPLDQFAQPGGGALMRELAERNKGTFVER